MTHQFIDTEIHPESTNPIQNQAVYEAIKSLSESGGSEEAQKAASEAKEAAHAAQRSADDAKKAVAEVKETAQRAETKADKAQSTADSAKSTASEAKKAAIAADATAGAAGVAAGAAGAAAYYAQKKADAAQFTANGAALAAAEAMTQAIVATGEASTANAKAASAGKAAAKAQQTADEARQIAQQALPQAGGLVTGPIHMRPVPRVGQTAQAVIDTEANTGQIAMMGGPSGGCGALLGLNSQAADGSFILAANDGHGTKALTGETDGWLQWDGHISLNTVRDDYLRKFGIMGLNEERGILVLGSGYDEGDTLNGAKISLYGVKGADFSGELVVTVPNINDKRQTKTFEISYTNGLEYDGRPITVGECLLLEGGTMTGNLTMSGNLLADETTDQGHIPAIIGAKNNQLLTIAAADSYNHNLGQYARIKIYGSANTTRNDIGSIELITSGGMLLRIDERLRKVCKGAVGMDPGEMPNLIASNGDIMTGDLKFDYDLEHDRVRGIKSGDDTSGLYLHKVNDPQNGGIIEFENFNQTKLQFRLDDKLYIVQTGQQQPTETPVMLSSGATMTGNLTMNSNIVMGDNTGIGCIDHNVYLNINGAGADRNPNSIVMGDGQQTDVMKIEPYNQTVTINGTLTLNGTSFNLPAAADEITIAANNATSLRIKCKTGYLKIINTGWLFISGYCAAMWNHKPEGITQKMYVYVDQTGMLQRTLPQDFGKELTPYLDYDLLAEKIADKIAAKIANMK